MACALTIVVAAKMPTLQHRSAVVTIVVKKKKHSRRYIVLNLVYNYCIGLTVAVNEMVPIKRHAACRVESKTAVQAYVPTDCCYSSCKR
jgi:hypothetical protein